MSQGEGEGEGDNNSKRRKAAQEWVKEHPGELAIQGGELAGIDRDTGEDIMETNKKRAAEKEAMKEMQEAGILAYPPNPPSPREVNHVSIPEAGVFTTEEPEVKLPDDFEGIRFEYVNTLHDEAQIFSFRRPDMDMVLPHGLPPDIVSKCRLIEIDKIGDPRQYYRLTVWDTEKHIVFTSTFPMADCIISTKGFRPPQ